MSLRFLTGGESHGQALVGIIEGIPSRMELDASYIQAQLTRRKKGHGRGGRQIIESDQVQILSGVRFGETLGSPISLVIQNQDWENWKSIMRVEGPLLNDEKGLFTPRPGHADLIGGIKYRHEDMRNVLERASARETAMRVALGSVARKLLEDLGIFIASRVTAIGRVEDLSLIPESLQDLTKKVDASLVRCLSSEKEEAMMRAIDQASQEGDTLGGIFEVYASGVPLGLGSYSQWDRRLEGKIAQSFMALNAIQGVEVGRGFDGGAERGSQLHDPYELDQKRIVFSSNRSGGILGGMSTGEILKVRAVMKPLSTLTRPLKSIDVKRGVEALAHVERSDVCATPSASVIAESLLALVLGDEILNKFGGDSILELKPRVMQWMREFSL